MREVSKYGSRCGFQESFWLRLEQIWAQFEAVVVWVFFVNIITVEEVYDTMKFWTTLRFELVFSNRNVY
jgi:hypothetical protein